MIRKLSACALLVFLLLFASPIFANDNSWLLGSWLLTYDPDGDTQDRLTFSEDGKFTTTEVSSGRQFSGLYFVMPGVVKIHLIQQGIIFMKFDLTYDEKRNKLYYKSDSTGNTSYYTKVEE